MKIDQYLINVKKTKKDAARELGITREHFIMVSNGKDRPGPKLSLRIEEWSNGAVTRHELRPDLWP
jgi:DNA-binding transcriptional regulator YdaS (Cro superfamily)